MSINEQQEQLAADLGSLLGSLGEDDSDNKLISIWCVLRYSGISMDDLEHLAHVPAFGFMVRESIRGNMTDDDLVRRCKKLLKFRDAMKT